MRVFAQFALVAGVAATYFENDGSMTGVLFGDEALRAARSPETVLRLHMMRDKGLQGMGAVCTDGTDAGFYFAPASTAADSKNWQIFFQGGGWCFDEMACWARSGTPLGSSAHWGETMTEGGIMSDDCSVNPDFCNFNRVHLAYCDGFSFAGDRTEPLVVTGMDGKKKPLYFRGKRILDATLQTLLGMGLNKAEQVLLTGCSAGGLATFLHADYVRKFLEAAHVPLKKFKAVPLSGFFLAHDTVEHRPVYVDEMRVSFSIANATGGLNEKCVAAYPQEHWKCIFAANSYPYTEAPIFPINSALDSWQTTCIYASEFVPGFPHQRVAANVRCSAAPGWGACAGNPEKCTTNQTLMNNQYMLDFEKDMTGAETWKKDGNGAFIHSCHTHCEGMSNAAWTHFKLKGVSMQQAVSKWWASDSAAASTNSYTDCLYRPDATPHSCNPYCGVHAAPFEVVV